METFQVENMHFLLPQVHENSPHGHRYHVQSAVAPTGYGYGHVGGYGHGGFGHGGFGGYGHGGFY